MGTVKPFPAAHQPTTRKTQRSTEIGSIPNIKKSLHAIEKEIECWLADPSAYPPKQLQKLMKEFFQKLTKHMNQKEGSTARRLTHTFFSIVSRARRLFRSDEVDDYGCDRRLEVTIKPFFDSLYSDYFRVKSLGLENIPSQGRVLLVANHSGVLPYDAAMIKVALWNEHPAKRELRFLVDDFVFHFPFLGTFMNRIGGIRACPENAERLLSQDEIISVFPEGLKGVAKPFSQRYSLQRFGRGGVIRVAMKTKSPIIPVAIVGAEEIHPLLFKSRFLARPLGLPFIPVTLTFPWLGPLGALPLPTKWTIQFGEPIAFDQYTSQDLNDGILINRETERLRQIIQRMLYQILRERKSVFFG